MASTQWRILVSLPNPGDVAIAELAMMVTQGGANQCTGGTASDSGDEYGDVAALAFDSNPVTFWATNASGADWLQYTVCLSL